MSKTTLTGGRRKEALSREQIIEASIDLLDTNGESGLTFRALSEKLSTGPGAIYWHIANKGELLTAACDAIIAKTVQENVAGESPQQKIRNLAIGIFDTIEAHPWVGSALDTPEGQMPMVRILEHLGQQVRAMGIDDTQWIAVGTLLNYILGVAGRHAANGQLAHERNLPRSDFLEDVAQKWSQLDPNEYPFVQSLVAKVRDHDDREDFIASIDLILKGIQ